MVQSKPMRAYRLYHIDIYNKARVVHNEAPRGGLCSLDP